MSDPIVSVVRQTNRAGNVRVRLNTRVVRAEGTRRLEALTVKDSVTGDGSLAIGSAREYLGGA